MFFSMDSQREGVGDNFQCITLTGAWNLGTLISEFQEKAFNFFRSFYHDDNNHSLPLNKHLLNVHYVPVTLLGHLCTFNFLIFIVLWYRCHHSCFVIFFPPQWGIQFGKFKHFVQVIDSGSAELGFDPLLSFIMLSTLDMKWSVLHHGYCMGQSHSSRGVWGWVSPDPMFFWAAKFSCELYATSQVYATPRGSEWGFRQPGPKVAGLGYEEAQTRAKIINLWGLIS